MEARIGPCIVKSKSRRGRSFRGWLVVDGSLYLKINLDISARNGILFKSD